MTKSLTPVQLANNLVVLVGQVNAIIDTLANEIVTANSAAGGGAVSAGNGFVTGIFGANTIVAQTLRGGNVVTSNTTFLGANLDANTWTIKSGSIVINSTVLTAGANLTLNTSSFFIGNSSTNTTVNSSSIVMWGEDSISLGANMSINTSAISIGNSVQNVVINSSGFLTALTTLSIGSNVTINTSGYFVGNATVNVFQNSSSLHIGANVIANNTSYFVGNTTASLLSNSTQIYLANTINNANIVPGALSVANSTLATNVSIGGILVGTTLINSTSVALGTNVIANLTTMQVGNSSAFTFQNSTIIQVIGTTQANLSPLGLTVGSSVVNTSIISVGTSVANTTAITTTTFVINAVSSNGSLGTAGQVLTSNGSTTYWGGSSGNSAIEFILDGGGSPLLTGVQGYIEVPYAATINQVTLLADVSGNVTIDIWKTTYSSFAPGTHPVVGDSITASAVPAISSAYKYQDATLSGWTTALSAGDILAFDVKVAATGATRVTCSLKIVKS